LPLFALYAAPTSCAPLCVEAYLRQLVKNRDSTFRRFDLDGCRAILGELISLISTVDAISRLARAAK
jgi:hypothetical protein